MFKYGFDDIGDVKNEEDESAPCFWEYDEDGNLITSDWPHLSTEWLDPSKKVTKTILTRPVDIAPGGASSDEVIQAPGGARTKDGPAQNTWSQITSDEFEPASFAASRMWGQPPAAIASLGPSSTPSQFHGNSKLTKASIPDQPILQDTWADVDDLEL